MPIYHNTFTATTRDANTALVTTLFPRFRQTVYSKVCGSTTSKNFVEPFVFDGSAPVLRLWKGGMSSTPVKSYTLQVPNLIWKNFENVSRSQIENDQTRTVIARMSQHGIRVSQTPDLIFAKRLLQGSTSGSEVQTLDGTPYTVTFDAKPVYSLTHTAPSGTAQSNIIQGQFPATKAALYAQDQATTINQIVRSVAMLNGAIQSVKDDRGMPMFYGYDPAEHLVLMCGSDLYPFVKQAASNIAVGGSNGTGGSSGSTDNKIGAMLVNEVISFGLLNGGFPDIESEDETATVSGTNELAIWAFVKNDLVQPWYFQKFRPTKKGETWPFNEDPEAQANKALSAARAAGMAPKVAIDASDLYANMEVDHNFSALGSNAQIETVRDEAFFISCRLRGNIFPGPWMVNWKIDPTGESD